MNTIAEFFDALNKAWDEEPETLIELGITDEVYVNIEQYVKRSNTQATPYQIYLFSQLFHTQLGDDTNELPYDELFEIIHDELYTFLNSEYNDSNFSEYDCMVKYLVEFRMSISATINNIS